MAERFHVEQSRRVRWKLQTGRGRTAESKYREVLHLLREIQVDMQVMTSGIVMLCDRAKASSIAGVPVRSGHPLSPAKVQAYADNNGLPPDGVPPIHGGER